MATTSEGLWYPDGTDIINPLHPVLAAMQTSVGVNPRMDTPAGIHSVADATGLTTLANDLDSVGYTISVSNPAYAYRADTQMIYENRGSGWAPYSNTLQFADATARDTAIPSGNRHVGMVAVIGTGTAMAVTVWDGTAWRTTHSDTGWVTTGLSITAATNFTVAGYRLRKIGSRVTGRVIATYSGPTVTANSSGVLATTGVVTLPAGWAPASFDQLDAAAGSGNGAPLLGGIVNSSGLLDLRAAPPSWALTNGSMVTLFPDFQI